MTGLTDPSYDVLFMTIKAFCKIIIYLYVENQANTLADCTQFCIDHLQEWYEKGYTELFHTFLQTFVEVVKHLSKSQLVSLSLLSIGVHCCEFVWMYRLHPIKGRWIPFEFAVFPSSQRLLVVFGIFWKRIIQSRCLRWFLTVWMSVLIWKGMKSRMYLVFLQKPCLILWAQILKISRCSF